MTSCSDSSSCDWCPLTQSCIASATFHSQCAQCGELTQTECAKAPRPTKFDDPVCSWCPSAAACVSSADLYNRRHCTNCTSVLARYQCLALPGCRWCPTSASCHESPNLPATCHCSQLSDLSACSGSSSCAWCPANASCVEHVGTGSALVASCRCTALPTGSCSSGGASCKQEVVSSRCVSSVWPGCSQAASLAACSGDGCSWDSEQQECVNVTLGAATACPARTTMAECYALAGCRWCGALKTCAAFNDARLSNGSCECSGRSKSETCGQGPGCRWCTETSLCVEGSSCPLLEALERQECTEASNRTSPAVKWCQTLHSCVSPSNKSDTTTTFCDCDSIPPSVCWWWQGCSLCPGPTRAAASSCLTRPKTCLPPESSGSPKKGGLPLPAIIGIAAGGGAAIIAIIVVAIVIPCVLLSRSRGSASAAAESGLEMASLDGVRPFNPAGLVEYAYNDPALGIELSKGSLDFGAASVPLEVDQKAGDQLVITNVGKPKVHWYVSFPTPRTEPTMTDRFTLACDILDGKLGRDEQIGLDFTLTPLCTTNLDFAVHVVNEGVGYTVLHVKARTSLTIKLDYEELKTESMIGEGAFGRVYKGTWRTTEVAIKEYSGAGMDKEGRRAEVLREIDLLSRLRSPYVVTFYGVVLGSAHCCLVMEYCPLGSLAALLAKQRLSRPLKIKFCLDCAKGMQFLHANKVLHRDLKPDNLLVVSTDPESPVHVKLTDLGASRLVSDEGASSTYTKGVGTCSYMAPELLSNEPYSSKADVYSFSLVCWSVWTQQVPYGEQPNPYAVIKLVVEGGRPPLPEPGTVSPRLSTSAAIEAEKQLTALMTRCWAANASSRPHFDEIVSLLEETDKLLWNGAMNEAGTSETATTTTTAPPVV